MKTLCTTDDSFKNSKDSQGNTVLHIAAIYGQLNAIEWFKSHNCNLRNTKDNDGNTPLHTAVIHGQVEAIEWITSHRDYSNI